MNNKHKKFVVLEYLTLPKRGFRFFTINCYWSGSSDNNTKNHTGEEWYKEVAFVDTIHEAKRIVECFDPLITPTYSELEKYYKEKLEQNK